MPNIARAASANAVPISGVLTDVTEQVAVIKQRHRATDLQRVERHLQSDSLSAELLVEAERHIQRVFSGGVSVLLDVTSDSSGIDRPFPYARIQTSETWSKVSQKFLQFNEEWWLGAGSRQ